MFDEIVRTNELKANGASPIAIQESEERQNILRENRANYRTIYDDMVSQNPVSENDYNAWIQSIIEMKQ